jgi:myosin heavy subunit
MEFTICERIKFFKSRFVTFEFQSILLYIYIILHVLYYIKFILYILYIIGGIFELKNVNDAEDFIALKNAFSTLKFNPNDITSLLDIMAGILHLGQISFEATLDNESCIISSNTDVMQSLHYASDLFGIDEASLAKTMLTRIITARGESYSINLKSTQASDAKDGLIKALYGKLFLWIVSIINQSISVTNRNEIKAEIGMYI